MRSWPDVKIKGELPFVPELELSKGVAENQLTLPEEQGEDALDWLCFSPVELGTNCLGSLPWPQVRFAKIGPLGCI